MDTSQRGASIEGAAREYLIAQGLGVIASNVSYRHGELDLVMLEPASLRARLPTLIFIEVRYRQDSRFGGGMASVNGHKRRKLIRAAQLFLQANPKFSKAHCRFDVIDASGDPTCPKIDWLRDAFRADDC